MNWDNPEERYNLIMRIGADDYNKAFDEYKKSITIKTVGGHAIRPVNTRFGRLWECGTTGRAFASIEEADAYAAKNPIE